jgi:transposase
VLAMVAGRLIYQGSKLFLSHQVPNTTLWEQCGVRGAVDVQAHCYGPMDRLLDRQVGIQKTLAGRHLQEGRLVLYDITSSYFEGQYEESEIVAFGCNRDGKRQHEHIVIGLICNPEGCPVGVEVFAGNTPDARDVPPAEWGAAQTVAGYEQLELVEQAFRQLKTVQLEVRPVYHKLDRRIRSHVFLCMLAYYLQWHIKQRLAPLFAQEGTHQQRRWSFAHVLERLKAIRQERVKLNGIEFNQISSPEADQQKILDLLKVRL